MKEKYISFIENKVLKPKYTDEELNNLLTIEFWECKELLPTMCNTLQTSVICVPFKYNVILNKEIPERFLVEMSMNYNSYSSLFPFKFVKIDSLFNIIMSTINKLAVHPELNLTMNSVKVDKITSVQKEAILKLEK